MNHSETQFKVLLSARDKKHCPQSNAVTRISMILTFILIAVISIILSAINFISGSYLIAFIVPLVTSGSSWVVYKNIVAHHCWDFLR